MEANGGMQEPEMDYEVITTEEVTQEYEIGEEPPEEDDDDAMEGVDDDEEQITEEDVPAEKIKDDARMVHRIHSEPVYSLDVNLADPRIVLSGGGDDVGIIWNRVDGSVLHTLRGHQDSVVDVSFSRDGKYAATAGYDGVVKIWDAQTGKLVQSLEGPSQEVEWISWHQKGYIILAGSGDGTIWMWLATTGECMHVFAGHEDGVTCGSFTGSGKMIVSGSGDATVRLWNPKTGECTQVFRGHNFHEGPICFITCHPTQPLLISCSQDGTARLVQLQAKRVLATFPHEAHASNSGEEAGARNSVECASFCHTMNWAATGCLGGDVRIWDLATYQCRHVCHHSAGVTKLMWHPSQPIVFSCTIEGLIYAWDARNGELLRTFSGHTDTILDMAFILDATSTTPCALLTASDDQSVREFALEDPSA